MVLFVSEWEWISKLNSCELGVFFPIDFNFITCLAMEKAVVRCRVPIHEINTLDWWLNCCQVSFDLPAALVHLILNEKRYDFNHYVELNQERNQSWTVLYVVCY